MSFRDKFLIQYERLIVRGLYLQTYTYRPITAVCVESVITYYF